MRTRYVSLTFIFVRMSNMKNDVLFINIPPINILAPKADATAASHIFPPLGLLCLAEKLLQCPNIHKAKCLDYQLFDYSDACDQKEYRKVISQILADFIEKHGIKPQCVCVSLMFSSSYDFFHIVIDVIRETIPKAIIICGGVHASNEPRFILNHEPIDYVICGEGEFVLPVLIESIHDGNFLPSMKGVYDQRKINETLTIEFTELAGDLDIDFTSYDKVVNMEDYVNRTSLFSLTCQSIQAKAFGVMASRGCPMRCTFCAAHTVHGHRPRWRSMKNICDEILFLHEKYGVNKIYLMDDNYFPKQKAIELFTKLSNLPIRDLDVVIQNMSINHTDFEIIDAVKNAGISYLPFAIETGSQEMQKKIKKYCDLNKAAELVKYAQGVGLSVRCFYIIGFPGETKEQMQQTIDFAEKVRADWSTFSVACPLPGSEMYAEFVKMGCIENSPEFWGTTTIRDRVFDTVEISASELKEMAQIANLTVNFVNNPLISEGRFHDAEIIFKNFLCSFDFHLFAHDALYRIYKHTGRITEASEILETMKELLLNNKKSQGFLKYLYLLEAETKNYLL